MATFIALLRGINVGGKHKLPMALLREHMEQAGALCVRTYIQSGNVVFESSTRQAKAITKRASASLEQAVGFAVPIIVRSETAWSKLIEDNPMPEAAHDDPKLVHALILDAAPTAAAARNFEPICDRGERVELVGDVVYVHYAQGSARSKLSVVTIGAALSRTGTARNWRTVLKLQAMASE